MKTLTKYTRRGLLILFIALAVVSCNKDEDVEREAFKPDNTIFNETPQQKRTTLEDLGYASVEDMINNGWNIVDEDVLVQKTQGRENNGDVTASIDGDDKVPFTITHLRQLGFQPDNGAGVDQIKEIYRLDGKKPDGISLNPGENISGVVSPNVSERMGLSSSVKINDPVVTVEDQDLPIPSDVTSIELVNKSDEESTMTSSYSYQRGQTKSWGVKVSSSLTIGKKVNVGIPGIGGAEASVNVTVGAEGSTGGTENETTTLTGSVTAKVPPRSKKTIVIVADKVKSEVTYKVPVSIEGHVGVNYPDRANGHYFWGLDANKFQKSDIVEEGVASLVTNMGVKAVESPAVPLTPDELNAPN
ncbi:ETX/MTX2 family pore-forming toxin [Aureivirga sp. CE67]|uniref:ETX/MTX2 family pore-forming toxin n=1 Tax=Aureivirga sp. CE67 TaxID=1788983 RepID=UPI0018C9CB6C|nr:ETX/MTX2 family pore-forming toxin [Aureivirga sp. CE67]